MRIETIDEPVKVRADFSGGEITPVAFRRKSKVYRIEKVNARWMDRAAEDTVHYFSVDSGGNTYELALRTRAMTWNLERVVLDD